MLEYRQIQTLRLLLPDDTIPSELFNTAAIAYYLKQFYLTATYILYCLLPENKTIPYSHRSRSLSQSHINLQINFL